jgi:hypothetical protein
MPPLEVGRCEGEPGVVVAARAAAAVRVRTNGTSGLRVRVLKDPPRPKRLELRLAAAIRLVEEVNGTQFDLRLPAFYSGSRGFESHRALHGFPVRKLSLGPIEN